MLGVFCKYKKNIIIIILLDFYYINKKNIMEVFKLFEIRC